MEFLTYLAKLDPQVIIQVMIQGGLAMTVVGLIWFLNRLAGVISESNKRYFNHTNDVIENNSKAITSQAVTNQKLSDSIDELIRHLKK